MWLSFVLFVFCLGLYMRPEDVKRAAQWCVAGLIPVQVANSSYVRSVGPGGVARAIRASHHCARSNFRARCPWAQEPFDRPLRRSPRLDGNSRPALISVSVARRRRKPRSRGSGAPRKNADSTDSRNHVALFAETTSAKNSVRDTA